MAQTLVVDCSVIAKWFLAEEDRMPAIELRNRWRNGDVWLIAPALLQLEFASLLTKRHRRNQFTASDVRRSYHWFARLSPELHDTRLSRALDLSLSTHLSLWDCCYLALALERDCPFITADRRLARGGKPRHPSITLLA